MTKNKITLRLSDDDFWLLKKMAAECNCSTTKMAEEMLSMALMPKGKTIEDCLLEVSVNSAAAVQELARIILADSPSEFERYQQSVVNRTKAALDKFHKQINGK